MRRAIAACLTVLALAWAGAALAVAELPERGGNGASVRFPGPESAVQQLAPETGESAYWRQLAPTPQDPDRAVAFAPLRPVWWLRPVMWMGPEAILLQGSERTLERLLEAYQGVSEVESDMSLVHINGWPGLEVTLERLDMQHRVLRADGQPALMANRRYVRTLLLWTGKAYVVASVGGSRPVAPNDPFLSTLTTAVPGVPGDPEQQWDTLCTVGGMLLIGLPILLLIAIIYGVDKAIKRRQRHAHATDGIKA